MSRDLIDIFVWILENPADKKGIKIKNAHGLTTWLPKSQIKEIKPLENGKARLTLPEWLADQEGLI